MARKRISPGTSRLPFLLLVPALLLPAGPLLSAGNETCVDITELLSDPGVPNFDVVIEGRVYRGGQPDACGMDLLLEKGIKTVIDLVEDEGDNDFFPMHNFYAYFHLRIVDHTPPSERQAKALLEIVRRSEFAPILIHCKAGWGRTGVVVALIRYAVEGWDMEEAMEEARRYRNGKKLMKISRDFLRKWAEKHPPRTHPLL